MNDDLDALPPDEPNDGAIVADAVRLFLTERHEPGDILPWQWLYAALGLPVPKQVNDVETYRRLQLRFVALRKRFETEMLTHHSVAFDTVIGQGVMIVPPGDQTSWAQTEMSGELRRAMSKGSARLRHVNLAMLTAAQKAQNSDALASFASLRGMLRAQLRRFDVMNGGSQR